jgi:hypothetical protein
MIEAGVALAALVLVLGALWWRDVRAHSGWDDLLAPDLPELQNQIARKFSAEERLARWSGDHQFLAGLVVGRVQLLRRLSVYERLIAAAAPPPRRLRARLRVLRGAFKVLARPDVGAETLASLDREALESCRLLAGAVAGMERER